MKSPTQFLTTLVSLALAQVSLGLHFTTSETALGPEAGGACAIVCDSAGRQHSAWLRDRPGGGRELKYTLQIGHLHQQGGNRVVDLPAETMPQKLDLAVDHLGNRHLVFIRADGALRYARRGALENNWTIRTLTSGASTDPKAGCSIQVGKVHPLGIAYTGDRGIHLGNLEYMWSEDSGENWTLRTVSGDAASGFYPSLVLDESDRRPVSIAHYDANQGKLIVSEAASAGATGWFRITVDSTGTSGIGASMVRLQGGGLGISYRHSLSTVTELRYAWKPRDSSEFTTETVESSTEYGTPPEGMAYTLAFKTALALDALGHPQIAYTQGRIAVFIPVTDQLRFARFIPGYGWDRHTVDTTADGGLTNGLDMCTNGAGDPTILYESETTSGDSSLLIARPSTRPFVSESPEFDVEPNPAATEYSAPSIVAAPGGGISTVMTTVENGITRFFFTIEKPGHFERIQIPYEQFKRVNSTALQHTRDGKFHIFSMRVNSPSATSGELLYTNYNGTNFSSSQTISAAIPVPPAVTTTPDGLLHVAFVHSSGELRYLVATPGSNQFNERHRAALDGGRGISIAARADGGVAIAYVHPASKEVRMISNISLRGALEGSFEESTVYFPSITDPLPKNAAVAIMPADGTTRVLFGLATTVRLAKPGPSGSTTFVSDLVAGGLSSAYVNLHPGSCNHLHGIAVSEDGGGTARHLEFDSGGGLTEFNTFFIHGRLPYSYDNQPYALAPAVDSALDAYGFPIAVLPVRTNGIVRARVIISRHADGLDPDGDGVPLVYENAHLMDPLLSDADRLPEVAVQSLQPAGSRADYFFRLPFQVPAREVLSNGSVIGEFEYTITASTDLRCFQNPYTPGFPGGTIIISGGTTAAEPGVSVNNLRLLFNSQFAAANPRAFSRFQVRRLR